MRHVLPVHRTVLGFFSVFLERGGGPLGYLAAQSLYLKCLGYFRFWTGFCYLSFSPFFRPCD